MGTYTKSNVERGMAGLRTYARVCFEIDISKGLLGKVLLKSKKIQHTPALDYENKTFCWEICHLPGHLKETYPQALDSSARKKGSIPTPKHWIFPKEALSKDDVDQNEIEKQETMSTGETTPFSQDKEEYLAIEISSLREVVEDPQAGTKRQHETNTSNFDKGLHSFQ